MKLVNYLQQIYFEGGGATNSAPMNKQELELVFKDILKYFLQPLKLTKENEDYYKVGSWNVAKEFDDTKTFGDIDILLNRHDKTFDEIASIVKTLYDKYTSNKSDIEFPDLKIMKGLKTISFAIPTKDDKFGQVDFFIYDDFTTAKFHFTHTEHTKIKGKFRGIALNHLVKLINPEWRWSPAQGLKLENKEIIKDQKEISKHLGFNLGDLTSFTEVWKLIKKHGSSAQLEEIKTDLLKFANSDEEKNQLKVMAK